MQKGQIYRREWNNLLFSIYAQPPEEKDLYYYDVRKPLPYPDQIFDNVYLFHILEHLTPEEATHVFEGNLSGVKVLWDCENFNARS